jgi:ubiquinone/menaquinone biosynthesis C-methylase UbiE
MVLNGMLAFLKKHLGGIYLPREYWEQRGVGYAQEVKEARFKEHVTPMHYSVLSRMLEKVKPRVILEIGCGTGRFFKLYSKFSKKIIASDISTSMLRHARNEAVRLGIDVDLVCASATHLPFKDKIADCIVTAEVLMHVPYADIGNAISALARVSDNAVVLEFYIPRDDENASKLKEQLESYNFLHDYPAIFKEANMTIVEKHELKELRQTCFLLKSP